MELELQQTFCVVLGLPVVGSEDGGALGKCGLKIALGNLLEGLRQA
jgi:hypothetical protein